MATPITSEAHAQAAFDASFDAAFADVPTTETPATPEPSTAETVAAPAEPEIKTEAPAAGPPPTQPTGEAAPKRRSDYEDWLNKYGGDKDKAAAESWRITRENAQLAKEREELRKQLEARTEPQAAPAEPEIPEEIRRIEEDIAGTRETSQRLLLEGGGYRKQSELYAQGIYQKNREIRSLSAQLARGGMELEQEHVLRQNLAKAHQEINDFEQAKAAFDAEVRRCDFEAARLVDRLRHLDDSKQHAERYLRLEQARAAEEERGWQAERDRDANAYDQTLRVQAKEIGLEPGEQDSPSKAFTLFKRAVLGPIRDELRSMEQAGNHAGLSAEEIQQRIRQNVLDYQAVQDEDRKAWSSRLAKTKEKQMATEGPTGKAAIAAPSVKVRPSEAELYDSLEF